MSEILWSDPSNKCIHACVRIYMSLVCVCVSNHFGAQGRARLTRILPIGASLPMKASCRRSCGRTRLTNVYMHVCASTCLWCVCVSNHFGAQGRTRLTRILPIGASLPMKASCRRSCGRTRLTNVYMHVCASTCLWCVCVCVESLRRTG